MPPASSNPDHQTYQHRRVIYLGLTDGRTTSRWLLDELDHNALLDELESRDKDIDRLVPLPGERGVLARVFRRLGGPPRTLTLYRVEPAGVISILKGDEIQEYDPGEDASLMLPSWARFHSGNRVAMLKGPGGAGQGDLEWFLNKLEPSLFQDVPRRGRATSIGLVPLLSKADHATIARTAQRVSALSVSLPPQRSIPVGESVLSEVITLVRKRIGSAVNVRVEVTASRRVEGSAEAAANLQSEVGHIVLSDDLAHFSAAKMTYDRDDQHDVALDLLADVVCARVKVSLGPRGALTDARCAEALTEAWAQVQDQLPWAVADGGENGSDDGGDEGSAPQGQGTVE